MPCKINKEGALTVNGKLFYNLLRSLNFDDINILEEENYKIKILSGDKKNNYKISGLDHENFPKLKHIDTTETFDIDSSVFIQMIEKVFATISTDATKIALSGVLFAKETIEDETGEKKEMIRLVSSDGHRLNQIEQYIDMTDMPDFEIIIPKKGINEIRKIIEKKEKFKFGFKEKECFVTTDGSFLLIRLITEKYPKYKQIIPKEFKDKIIIDRQGLINVLNRISIVSSAGGSEGFKLKIIDNGIEISSIENQIGEISEELEAQFSEQNFIIGLNEGYLLNLLNLMKSEKIFMMINHKDSPCMVMGDNDKGFFGLVMPFSIEEE
jgi:DNA polymerase-3 subunit beta